LGAEEQPMIRSATRRSGLTLSVILAWAVILATGVVTAQEPELVNINTASVEELQVLPRIGPVVAQRIVDYREKNGAFEGTAELMNVNGIGEKTFSGLKHLITVGEGQER
jgi:competence protein ComEA